MTEPSLSDLFGPPISIYTRAQAIEDGELVDVSTVAREAGLKFPVALTRAVFEDCVAWSADDTKRKGGWPQDESGRLWDVLWMFRCNLRHFADSDTLVYRMVRVPRAGRGTKARHVTLKAVCGPGDDAEPVITIMQPDED